MGNHILSPLLYPFGQAFREPSQIQGKNRPHLLMGASFGDSGHALKQTQEEWFSSEIAFYGIVNEAQLVLPCFLMDSFYERAVLPTQHVINMSPT